MGRGGSKIRETAPVSSPVAGPFPSLGWGGSPGDPPPRRDEGTGERPAGRCRVGRGRRGRWSRGGWKLMQSGPGSHRRSRGSRFTSAVVAGTREGRTDGPESGHPPTPPPRSVPVPVFGGDRAASTPVPDPTARPGGVSLSLSLPPSPPASPRPGRRLPGGCAGPRGAAAGSGRRAAPPAPLPAITHPRILFIHKNRVMR